MHSIVFEEVFSIESPKNMSPLKSPLIVTTADSYWEKVEQKGDIPLSREGHSMM